MTHTVLLLDVDGVLNASRAGWSAPPRSGNAYAGGQSFRLRWSPAALARLTALHRSGAVEVRWATTWCPYVDQLHRLFGVGPWAAAFTARPTHLTWDEVKVEAALGVLSAGGRLVWIDDTVVGPARQLYQQFAQAEADGLALLIAPQSSRGLRPDHLDAVEAFALTTTNGAS